MFLAGHVEAIFGYPRASAIIRLTGSQEEGIHPSLFPWVDWKLDLSLPAWKSRGSMEGLLVRGWKPHPNCMHAQVTTDYSFRLLLGTLENMFVFQETVLLVCRGLLTSLSLCLRKSLESYFAPPSSLNKRTPQSHRRIRGFLHVSSGPRHY